MNKKLQVFVSSTYTDLIDERQAAVEAILDAGHIPAGMELFKAGNESQLKTIYKWIDESDVYMLILGGRYGSIEPKSGKSYTQLEYEYAQSKNIPIFSVVLSEAFLTSKINLASLKDITEQVAPDKYQSFKTIVMSKIIREVDDCKDIKLAVHSTLNSFMSEYDLIGWVRNTNENENLELLKENRSLLKENNSLNKQIQNLKEQLKYKTKEQIGDYSFDELVNMFKKKVFVVPAKVAHSKTDVKIPALDLFILNRDTFITGIENKYDCSDAVSHLFHHIAPYFISFGLLEKNKVAGVQYERIQTSKLGSKFYALIESKGITIEQ